MTFFPSIFRVRLELTREKCLGSPEVPADVVERCKQKMETLLKSGAIAFYILHDKKLEEFWIKFKNSQEIGLEKKIFFPLADGCPPINGIKIVANQEDPSAALISIELP